MIVCAEGGEELEQYDAERVGIELRRELPVLDVLQGHVLVGLIRHREMGGHK